MIVFDPGAGDPAYWFVCFCKSAGNAWVERLPIGKYKHVKAFGCVQAINTWVFFDPALDRTSIEVARGADAERLMNGWLADADVVKVRAVKRKLLLPRFGGWCVPAVKHLTGIRSSALRPDALYDDCLRNGAEVVSQHGCAESRTATA